MLSNNLQEPSVGQGPESAPADRPSSPFPVPSIATFPIIRNSSSLNPVVCNERVIARLLEAILVRSGLSVSEAARRMGTTPNNLRQYINGRRKKPSLIWVVRFAEICGAKLSLELPTKGR